MLCCDWLFATKYRRGGGILIIIIEAFIVCHWMIIRAALKIGLGQAIDES